MLESVKWGPVCSLVLLSDSALPEEEIALCLSTPRVALGGAWQTPFQAHELIPAVVGVSLWLWLGTQGRGRVQYP